MAGYSTDLDNPIWNSLTTRHSHLAIGQGPVRRYPAEIAPFGAIGDPSEEAATSLRSLFKPGERAGIASVIPEDWQGWQIHHQFEVIQYVWDQPSGTASPCSYAVRLQDEHLQAMFDLTALVYPAYFRKGTAELGDYFGIIQDGELCAMAGIRMAFHGHQEISAVCTHPDHRGKGHARELTSHLVAYIENQGDMAFLHTESDNLVAQKVYDGLGFTQRALLPIYVVDRLPD